ncbi:hypothetical protein [Marinifilum sp.]
MISKKLQKNGLLAKQGKECRLIKNELYDGYMNWWYYMLVLG